MSENVEYILNGIKETNEQIAQQENASNPYELTDKEIAEMNSMYTAKGSAFEAYGQAAEMMGVD